MGHFLLIFHHYLAFSYYSVHSPPHIYQGSKTSHPRSYETGYPYAFSNKYENDNIDYNFRAIGARFNLIPFSMYIVAIRDSSPITCLKSPRYCHVMTLV